MSGLKLKYLDFDPLFFLSHSLLSEWIEIVKGHANYAPHGRLTLY
ncbi:hypothetical protein RV09_GL001983 [Enterococcus moraviensis]|nr:hypothetical protein RV09_GL001983 [Enterococcus moraviensis]